MDFKIELWCSESPSALVFKATATAVHPFDQANTSRPTAFLAEAGTLSDALADLHSQIAGASRG